MPSTTARSQQRTRTKTYKYKNRLACFILDCSFHGVYISHPISTQILTENEPILFPDVTICPVSPVSYGSDSTLEKLNEIKYYVTQKLKYAGLPPNDVNVEAALLIQLATNRKLVDSRSYDHIMYCMYNGKHCSFANFTEVYHLRYLKCFTFSPHEDARRLTVGSGLTFAYVADKNGTGPKPYMLLNDLESRMFDAPQYDGVNVFLHSPGTFPGYEISGVATSFAVHFGQIARVQVNGLQSVSSNEGNKKCYASPPPYRYSSFGGATKYLEYQYTYEDCVANRKQSHILETCGCYSDLLQVPHNPEPDDDPQAIGVPKVLDLSKLKIEFCRGLHSRTSQQVHSNFECHDRLSRLPTSSVLDAYINPDQLWDSRDNPDMRKKLRQDVCPVNCKKMHYQAHNIEIREIDQNFTLKLPLLTKHMMDLNLSTLDQGTPLHRKWAEMLEKGKDGEMNFTEGKNIVIIDIRLRSARVDTWNEELTSSLFSLMASIGGTLGLCAGISFVSAFFLLLFFGNAFYHLILSVLLWFWWSVFQGQPEAIQTEKMFLKKERLKENGHERGGPHPFIGTGRMRAVSRVVQEERKSTVYDTGFATPKQYERSRNLSLPVESNDSLRRTSARRSLSQLPESMLSTTYSDLGESTRPVTSAYETKHRLNRGDSTIVSHVDRMLTELLEKRESRNTSNQSLTSYSSTTQSVNSGNRSSVSSRESIRNHRSKSPSKRIVWRLGKEEDKS
nr:hypothetical transcript [Hymenolepis microstoma]